MATPKKGYWLDGKRLPSVTTILSRFKDSGGLLYWAFNQGLEQGTEIALGKTDEAPDLYKVRDEAGAAGTLAHEMVEVYVNGGDHMKLLKKTNPTELNLQALNAFQQFREWHENSKIEIISKYHEIQMISEEYRYGGTPDAIGRNVNGELVLLDWKTSNAIYSDYLLQLAGYKQLWEEHNPDKPITGGFYILRFSKEFPDFSAHYYGELDTAWRMFRALIACYGFDKELKKRCK